MDTFFYCLVSLEEVTPRGFYASTYCWLRTKPRLPFGIVNSQTRQIWPFEKETFYQKWNRPYLKIEILFYHYLSLFVGKIKDFVLFFKFVLIFSSSNFFVGLTRLTICSFFKILSFLKLLEPTPFPPPHLLTW